jgi:hypothetical protein
MWVSQLAALTGRAVAARGQRQVDAVVGAAKPDVLVAGGHRGGDVGRLVPFADLADEPETLAGDGVDEALLLAAVADGAAGGVNAAGEGGVGHDAAVPDAGDQVVLADHARAVADQEQQQVEDLRLDRRELARAAQLAPVGVEDVVFEEKQHVSAPQRRLPAQGGTLTHPADKKNQGAPKHKSRRPESRPSARLACSARARSRSP